MTRDIESDGYVSSDNSDAELQELFAANVLKPGLIREVHEGESRTFANDRAGLEAKLKEIKTDHYSWIERLDLANDPAPMPPEMAYQIDNQENRLILPGARKDQGTGQLDEFKRESLFYRQAQSAVLEGLARLKSLGIPTRRPEDYFAEMAKTDTHMQKVRQLLLKKQTIKARIEKVRHIREQKKLNKQLQAELRQKKDSEKRELNNEVKKFRKGIRKDLDFLDDKKQSSKKKQFDGPKKANQKRQFKDMKFGFGGKKRGTKRNTRESTDDYVGRQKGGRKTQMKNKRPGKSVRQKQKSQKRR